jgi:hypothetical protein
MLSHAVCNAAPRSLRGAALLTAWEQIEAAAPSERAPRLIALGWPDMPPDAIHSLNVALRDSLLLRLRAACFGPELELFFACHGCGTAMELGASVAALCAALEAAAESAATERDGYALSIRLADSDDLLAAEQAPDLETAQMELLTRCVRALAPDGSPVTPLALPPPVLAHAVAAADALLDAAEILFDSTCMACGARHRVAFDPSLVLWRELRHAASHLLDEIHELAWAYGWAEDAILRMSPTRRRAYLNRVRQ